MLWIEQNLSFLLSATQVLQINSIINNQLTETASEELCLPQITVKESTVLDQTMKTCNPAST